MNTATESNRADLGGLLRILRRRAILIVVAVVVALGAAWVFSNSQKKQYTGTAVLLFRPLFLDAQLAGLPLTLPNSDPTVEAATDVGLIALPQVRARAARTLGPPYTVASLKPQVSASAEGKSSLVDVQGTASTPTAAAAIANAVATGFISLRRQTLVHAINKAIATVRRQIRSPQTTTLQRAVLRNNLTKLLESRSVQPGDVSLAGTALPPTSPSAPTTTLNLIIGGALGLLLGLALALIAEQLDRRVRRPEEVGDALELPVLASIPRSRVLKNGTGLSKGLSDSDIEAFRLLRANLRYRFGSRELRSILLTSASPGSGKTTVALHLASAAAAALDGNVLLIEADIRRPRLAALLGVPSDKGLSSALLDSDELSDVVVTIPSTHSTNGSSPSTNGNGSGLPVNASFPASFDVVVAGPPTPLANELLGSEHMRHLLQSAMDRYALVIVEGPPPGLVSDAIPIMKQVDAVVLVAGLGRENSPELRRLRAQLDGLAIEPLGVVANFSRRTSNAYVSSSQS